MGSCHHLSQGDSLQHHCQYVLVLVHATTNIYYVYFLSDYFDTTSQSLALLRLFSAIPAHGIFGATMGYFFMKYAFIKKENNLAL